jgi:aldehyde:ferredoxin oxidoreductase
MVAPPDRFSDDEAAYCAYVYQNASFLFNNLTMCKFMVNNGGLTVSDISQELAYTTGILYNNMELLKTAERGMAIQRLINVRDGIRKADDSLPPKMRQAAVVGGRAGKAPLNFDKMLKDYYLLRGWDDDGIPTKEALEKLDLGDYVKYIPR